MCVCVCVCVWVCVCVCVCGTPVCQGYMYMYICRGHSHHVLLLCQRSWQTLVRISGRDTFQTYLQNRSGPCADQIRKARPLCWQIRASQCSAKQQHVPWFFSTCANMFLQFGSCNLCMSNMSGCMRVCE